MADAPARPPPPKMGFLPMLTVFAVIYIILQPGIRLTIGQWFGKVFDPAIGFNGRYPVMTILIASTLVVVISTVVRHFTTDWLEAAKTQAAMRHFQREMMKARKENNTYKLKILQDAQPEIMARQQKLQTAQFKSMPLTLILFTPVYAWLGLWLLTQDYTWYSAPWNLHVDMFASNGMFASAPSWLPVFGTSVFPHYVALYACLSIPVGSLLQKSMKYLSWKERWQKRHPEAHE